MSRKFSLAIITALMFAAASAVVAKAAPQNTPNYFSCQTDEGQGRMSPCDAGGAGG
jgi:hypothetical protein